MSELKPCPFCGSRKTLEYLYPISRYESEKVNCEHCMPKHIDLKKWNSRPIEDELRAERDKARIAAGFWENWSIDLEKQNNELKREVEAYKVLAGYKRTDES